MLMHKNDRLSNKRSFGFLNKSDRIAFLYRHMMKQWIFVMSYKCRFLPFSLWINQVLVGLLSLNKNSHFVLETIFLYTYYLETEPFFCLLLAFVIKIFAFLKSLCFDKAVNIINHFSIVIKDMFFRRFGEII